MQRAGIVFVAMLGCAQRVPPITSDDPRNVERPSRFTVARPTPFSSDRRLPRPLVPTSYRAHLALAGDRIDGTLEITGDLAAPTDTLWVHADELVIQHARAVSATTTVLLEPRVPFEDRRMALLAEHPLPAGRWTLELSYTAKIADHGKVDLRAMVPNATQRVDGVFRQHVDGRSYVATMFEPRAARSRASTSPT